MRTLLTQILGRGRAQTQGGWQQGEKGARSRQARACRCTAARLFQASPLSGSCAAARLKACAARV